MSDNPEFSQHRPQPPAGYFEALPARVLWRHRVRRTRRRVLSGLAAALFILGSSLTILFNPSNEPPTPDKQGRLTVDSFSHNADSELWALTTPENHPADSPSNTSVPITISPLTAPQVTDTILTREDILDYLLDENYLDV